MPYRDYMYMLEIKDIVEHRRLLTQLQASAYPHSKPENAKNFHRKVVNRAFPVSTQGTTSNRAAYEQFKRMTRNG